MGESVVVTGMECITAVGENLETSWGKITKGQTNAGHVQGINYDQEHLTDIACHIGNRMSPEQGLGFFEVNTANALRCMANMVDHYGFDQGSFRNSGLIVASTSAGMGLYEEFHEKYNQAGKTVVDQDHLDEGLYSLFSCVMEGIAYKYQTSGFMTTIESACASGSVALIMAHDLIAQGAEEMVIVVGVDMLCNTTFNGFSALKVMESKVYRPFDQNREGLFLGDGAAVIVLESEAHALKRKGKIIGRLKGGGLTCDAHDLTAPHPEGKEAQLAMEKAIGQSGISIEDIGYINAHGTGTVFNDITETKAIKGALGEGWKQTHVSSTKSMTGHTLGAAGVLEAVLTLKSLNESLVPPTANLEDPAENCQLNHVIKEAVHNSKKAAMSNSFGFGGINASVIFEKY